MNEIEKAIDYYGTHSDTFKYADVALSALEKQIPKPALLEKLRIQTKATCPNCKEAFAWVIKTDDLPAYCPKCGQKNSRLVELGKGGTK